MSQPNSSQSKPVRGSLWKHPRYHWTWRVESAGPKWITLRPTYPTETVARVKATTWPRDHGSTWEPA